MADSHSLHQALTVTLAVALSEALTVTLALSEALTVTLAVKLLVHLYVIFSVESSSNL